MERRTGAVDAAGRGPHTETAQRIEEQPIAGPQITAARCVIRAAEPKSREKGEEGTGPRTDLVRAAASQPGGRTRRGRAGMAEKIPRSGAEPQNTRGLPLAAGRCWRVDFSGPGSHPGSGLD
ncbi:hypothetical protein NDU88_002675 [Pleurodeles waltl]|uniref:Uncharacterized protein n=1 Tax=Pleurodeles waltl TaxID=8319 RepID=A0AAV7VEH8_PLEWA|nr:hypothetical protein NDU88_002675 [Pleurodeles waltl]